MTFIAICMVLILGGALLVVSLKKPKNPILAGIAAFGIVIALVLLFNLPGVAASIGSSIGSISIGANLFLALAVGALIGALMTSERIWLVAFLVFAGAYLWLGLGASFLVFVFAVLAATFVVVESEKRTTLWVYLAVAAAVVTILLAVGTTSSVQQAQAPTAQVAVSATR